MFTLILEKSAAPTIKYDDALKFVFQEVKSVNTIIHLKVR